MNSMKKELFGASSYDIITTNLNYRPAELLTKPWYVEADMSKYLASIINTVNHDVSISELLSNTDKIQRIINKYNNGEL